MDIEELIKKRPGLARFLEVTLGKFPFIERKIRKMDFVKKQIDKDFESILESLENELKPYRGNTDSYQALPITPVGKKKILTQMEQLNKKEEHRWKKGYVSGAVYHGNKNHIDFLNQVYALNSQSNPLHSDLWPSASKYESEIVSMTANMLGANPANIGDEKKEICGVVSSGGTDSILLAMKAYRDYAYTVKGIKKPHMIVPVTAHAAFDKAAKYFGIKKKVIGVDENYQADLTQLKKAIDRNTIVIVGSAPSFPHGIIDPIRDMSDMASEKGIGFHTDACLGGFVLPWVHKAGYKIPDFDFKLPGVTSISVDTHKFGYAAKGTSVILYRGHELRHFQYYTITDWPGGIYFSPTFAGSRPGALVASCWAALISIGEKGYIENTKRILKVAEYIKKEIQNIPEIYILGNPLWVIAFGSRNLNIYRIMEEMSYKGWNLNGLHKPACIHICLTLPHTQKGVAQRFIQDLKASVKFVSENPSDKGELAPVYGMASAMPVKSVVSDLLKKYLDIVYKV